MKKVIEETGYQPSFSAKSLATPKSNLVGLIYRGDVEEKIIIQFLRKLLMFLKKELVDKEIYYFNVFK